MSRTPAPVLCLALLLAACRAPEGPAERYQRFAAAARAGRAGEVWAMLSEPSRKALRDRAKALEGDKPPAGIDVKAADLVVGDLAPTAPKVKSVTVVRESAEAAVVAVEEEGGGRGEVSLVREGGEWRVELPR
jgi:hypothetical protein